MLRNVRHCARVYRPEWENVDGIPKRSERFLVEIYGVLAGLKPEHAAAWAAAAPGALASFLTDEPLDVAPLDEIEVVGLQPREAVLGGRWTVRAVEPSPVATRFLLSR